MPSYLSHVLRLARRQPLSWVLLEGLARFGIRCQPYVFFEERVPAGAAPPLPAGLGPVETRLLGPADMSAVASFPWRGIPEEDFLKRLERGCGCLGLRANGVLVAFSWYDLRQCTFIPCPFPLASDEAYLFDACTLPAYRGTGLAPFLRDALYRELAAFGRIRFLSVSDRTNRAAVRFKEKLGARKLFEGWSLDLFGRWHHGPDPPDWIARRRNVHP